MAALGQHAQRQSHAQAVDLLSMAQVPIDTPRDRDGSFDPKIVKKRQRRFEGFDDKILALYSRGLSTRDIEAHIAEIYGVHVGRDLISSGDGRGDGRRPRVAATAVG